MRRGRAARRLAAGAGAALLALSATGCGGLLRQTARSYALAASGLPTGEQRLRDALAAGRWGDALARAAAPDDGGPDDALLRALYAGTAAYYAARWAEADSAFERAAALADDRYTKSASRGALALLTSDLALPYVPGQNERLFVHYYAMLGRLRRGDAGGAAVEARRLGFLLERSADDGRDPLDARTRGVLRYLAGTAFEAAGEREDAAVAYRNARALLGELPAPAPADPATGDVVVVVEQGFVAHRVGEALTVRVRSEGDWDLLLAAGRGAERGGSALARVASLLAGDGGLWADALPRELVLDGPPGEEGRGEGRGEGRERGDVPGTAAPRDATAAPWVQVLRHAAASRGGSPAADAVADVVGAAGGTPGDEDARRSRRRARAARPVLRVAWPAYRRPRGLRAPLTVTLSRDPEVAAPGAAAARRGPLAAPSAPLAPPRAAPLAAPVVAAADVSDAVVADFKRDRARRLARLLVRAAARAAAVEQAGKKHRELGDLVSGLGRALERADTRSWHLLPGRVSVARLRLPAGRRAVTVTVGDAVVSLGEVDVPAGGVALATGRIY